MKNVTQELRKIFLEELDGNVSIGSYTLSIYNYVPYNASYPYIRVYTDNQKQTQFNQSVAIVEANTKIEVVHRYSGDSGGQLIVEQIANQIVNLLSQMDLSITGINAYTLTNPNIFYLEEALKDHTYYRAIIEINNQVETEIS